MKCDDNPAGSGGARRIYRFHLGWASAGRVNHFDLADSAPREPTGTRGARISEGAPQDIRAARAATPRSSAPRVRSSTRRRTGEAES